MSPRFFRLVSSAILSVALLGGISHAQDAATAQVTAQTEQQPWTPKLAAEALPEKELVLKVNGKPLTVRQLKFLLNLRPLTETYMDPEAASRLRGEDLEKVGKHVGAYDLLAGKAREAGLKIEGEDDQRVIDSNLQRYANQLLYEQVITSKLTEPDEETLKAQYEREREDKYKKPEELRLRHIWVSTYQPYTVQEGDTLESIAEKISGDVAMADLIVVPETGRPRAEGLEKKNDEEGEKLPPRALMADEELLVPAPSKKGESGKEKIDQAYEKLKAGEKFETVATEFSESDKPGGLLVVRPKDSDRPIMPELREAFMKLQDKAFSEPLKTKHGYQIVYREGYQEEGYRPFDQVKTEIKNSMRAEQVNKLVEEFFTKLVNDTETVKFNDENINKETRAPEDVLVTIGEEEYTYQRLKDESQGFIDQAEYKGADGLKKLLPRLRSSQQQLVDLHIEKSKFAEMPEMSRVRELVTDTLLAQKFIDKQMAETVSKPTDEEIGNYYNMNLLAYKVPESYSLFKVSVPLAPDADDKAVEEAEAKLRDELKGVQSVEEFRQIADSINRPGPRTRPGGEMGRVSVVQLGDAEKEAVRAVEAPGKTGVIRTEREVAAYWVADPQEEKTLTLEEKKEEIGKILEAQKRQQAATELVQDHQKEVKVEVLAKTENAE